MQKLRITALSLLLIMLAAIVGTAATAAADILVLRGQSAETVKSMGSERAVLRGVPSQSTAYQVAPGHMGNGITTGGKRIWLVDGRTGTIISCDIRGTGIAGKIQVYCTVE